MALSWRIGKNKYGPQDPGFAGAGQPLVLAGWKTKGWAMDQIGRIIETPACVAEGAQYLAEHHPKFAEALELIGPIPLRRRSDGFESLLDAIVGQQVSVAAADAIWARLKAARLTGPRKISAASDDELRACGLSRQKIRYARELAASGI